MLNREQMVTEISRAVLVRLRERLAAEAALAVPAPGVSGQDSWAALLDSPEAAQIKEEILRVGVKLWQRQYVDGNGGNISCRLTEQAVICTPTLRSKADLKPEDLVLVDLQGNQLAGRAARTSEILLHLEIYQAVPQAKAVVHCHPPHATAYSITRRVPPNGILPEFEVFVGRVALAPYETPGTKKFAETVLPFAPFHNTILLSNHGVVCWADTPTHAEWYTEILETYCWTLAIAQQMGAPVVTLPADKVDDLLAIKRRWACPTSVLPSLSVQGALLAVPPASPPRVRRPVQARPSWHGRKSNPSCAQSLTQSWSN